MVCELHHGDWRDVVGSWPSPCALIVDPPYGVRHRVTDSHSWARAHARGDFVKQPGVRNAIAGDRDTTERNEALEEEPMNEPNTIDAHGIVHTTAPGRSEGRGPYNVRGCGFMCGCQPVIHRFKCSVCKRCVGWCMGCGDDDICDDCSVAKSKITNPAVAMAAARARTT